MAISSHIIHDALTPSLLLVSAFYLIYRFFLQESVQNLELPVVGTKENEWFSSLRASWRNSLDCKTAGWLAWEDYGSKNKACIFPIIMGADLVLLPHSELLWMLDQPDTVLDHKQDLADSWLLEHTFMTRGVTENPIHEKVLSGKFTGRLGDLAPELMATIDQSVTAALGHDTASWKEVNIQSTMRALVAKSTNRAMLGEGMAENQRLIDTALAFALDMMASVAMLQLVWKPLRPLAALLITLPNRLHSWKFHRILKPEIEQRVGLCQNQRSVSQKRAGLEPEDLLQLLISQAQQLGDPFLCETDTLAARILILNFAAVFTTTFAMTHAILDLTGYGPRYVEELRAEIKDTLRVHSGRWTKHALAEMVKLDSFMRESQRMNSLVTMAVRRTVVDPNGVTTPSGVHIPRGHTVATYILPQLFDPALYPEPENFRPFRFSNQKGPAWASTSPTYLAWGHGRHACPGRFFASTSIKLHLAYLILHYEFEMRPDGRPRNRWLGLAQMPPADVTARVKRRLAI